MQISVALTTVTNYADAIAFELYALESNRASPARLESTSIDMRSGSGASVQASICLHENLSQTHVDQVYYKLAPLMFGAAWKVLDLLLELALNRHRHSPPKVWRIDEKQQHARDGDGDYLVLTSSKPLWNVVLKLYDATVEHRHCLVHRTAKVNVESGTFEGVDRPGLPITPLTRAEQIAIARLAGVVARGVIKGGMDRRDEDQLRYLLNQVIRHTGAPPFSVSGGLNAPIDILMTLERTGDHLVLDMTGVLDRARARFRTAAHFDLLVDIPGESERKLFARAEEVPAGRTVIDLAALPPWLSFR